MEFFIPIGIAAVMFFCGGIGYFASSTDHEGDCIAGKPMLINAKVYRCVESK